METAVEHFKLVRERLKSKDLIMNPFNGIVKMFQDKEQLYIFVDINPVYPNPYPLFLISCISSAFFIGLTWSWYYLIPIMFFIGMIPHSVIFYYSAYRLGLRKKGYAGDITYISKSDGIRYLLTKCKEK